MQEAECGVAACEEGLSRILGLCGEASAEVREARAELKEACLVLSDEITNARQRQRNDLAVSLECGHYKPTIDERVARYLGKIATGSRILFASPRSRRRPHGVTPSARP
jgi:hypothetical protein